MRIDVATWGKAIALAVIFAIGPAQAEQIVSAGAPAQLDIWKSGTKSIRVVLRPLSETTNLPYSPALVEQDWGAPALSLRSVDAPIKRRIGGFVVTVTSAPLAVSVETPQGESVQHITMEETGTLSFQLDDQPVLGMGEGGPRMGEDWRNEAIEFDRRGRLHEMVPRWQAQAYGSRNPVPLMIGASGWALFVATPWGSVDMSAEDRGVYTPWSPAADEENIRAKQGRPPEESIVPGVYDFFIFDAHEPAAFMKEIAALTGPAVMPPKWSLGYMQSHRTLEGDSQMLGIVDTFREKRIPVDAVIYLGTGFAPSGWNTEQPSMTFNPEVFKRAPAEVMADLHERNVKTVVHIVPWKEILKDGLHGNIPARSGETIDENHIQEYWKDHVPLFSAGVDAFWPDEGDPFDLFSRVVRHQLYYQGPLSSRPNTRPWSLHRNGYLGIAQWGGWVWSGDTDASWKTLEGQIAVGINHSLSLSPYWGSDIGGFYPNPELTGELYARWFQFAAFTPSFRSHGKTWHTRLPWGWGLSELGPLEHRDNPLESSLNNPAIEPIARQYDELRYQLMPYTYTLAREARDTGLPFMRSLWLHYPEDKRAAGVGDEYLWGRDMLIAPVYKQGASARSVYLPAGEWYDWWSGEKLTGGRDVSRSVDLATMPIYVRAGAVIPFDPVRQYTAEAVEGPTTIKVFRGADGTFTLYEDDGETLDYLKGEATWTKFSWDDSKGRLRIAPGSKSQSQAGPRIFRVEVHPGGASKLISYSGKPVALSFSD